MRDWPVVLPPHGPVKQRNVIYVSCEPLLCLSDNRNITHLLFMFHEKPSDTSEMLKAMNLKKLIDFYSHIIIVRCQI